jgi:hypothetical protein
MVEPVFVVLYHPDMHLGPPEALGRDSRGMMALARMLQYGSLSRISIARRLSPAAHGEM